MALTNAPFAWTLVAGLRRSGRSTDQHLLLDRNLGTQFFNAKPAATVLWQPVLPYSHPAVYIIVLPAWA
jgi:hypothetical protein